MYCKVGDQLPFTMEGISMAVEEVEGDCLRGLMVYGVPVGSPAYVTYTLRDVAREIIEDAKKTREVLGHDHQDLWTAP